MDRTEAIDGEVGLPARPDDARLWLDLDAGLVFAEGLKPRRVGLPDLDHAFCAGRIRT